MTTEVAERETGAVQAQGTPSDLLRVAINKDLDLDKIERLMDLQERWNADQARKAFFAALSDMQAEMPDIQRLDNGHNSTYAKLSRIVKAVAPVMQQHGFSHRYNIEDLDSGMMRVTCVVTHKDGHSESTTMTAGADTSGSKNAIQAMGSTVTYLQRYTLCGALGIVTADKDTDGGKPKQPEPTVNASHIKVLRGLLNQLPPDTEERMLRNYQVAALDALPAKVFDQATRVLNKHLENIERATVGETEEEELPLEG